MKSLINVTRKAELGLLLVSELALHPGEPVSLESVAQKAGVSRKFLEEVAGGLRRSGIVQARRGAAGGYRLAREADSLTVAEVLAAVEGPMGLAGCTAHGQERGPAIITKVRGQVMATLMNTTVADLA